MQPIWSISSRNLDSELNIERATRSNLLSARQSQEKPDLLPFIPEKSYRPRHEFKHDFVEFDKVCLELVLRFEGDRKMAFFDFRPH